MAQFQNAFQSGQQFALEQDARQQQQRLRDEENVRRQEQQATKEEQRTLQNQRQTVADEQVLEDREREQAVAATRNVVSFFKAGIEAGASVEEITQRAAPALIQLGVPEEQLQSLAEQIEANPEILDELDATLQISANRRPIGQPIEIRLSDGTVGLRTSFSDGTSTFEPGVTKTERDLQRQRIGQGAERIAQREPEFLGEVEEEKAVGRGRGKVRAEDLPTSRVKIAEQRSKIRTMTASTDIALDALENAKKQVNGLSTGFVGGVSKFVPGTSAFKLVERLLPVVSQEFVNNLQNMRNLSKTGGAVGNVSDAEGNKLQAVRASLNIGVGKEQLLEQMEIMRRAILESRRNVEQAFQDDQNARGALEGETNEDIDALLDKFAPVGEN